MSFAKHETFYIREGWLFKGMAAIKKAEDDGQLPTIFLDTDAPERLGIGHNMVRSLRFWMQAIGLVEEKQEERQRAHRLSIKNFLVEPGTFTLLCMPINVIADLLVYAFENIYYFVVPQLLPELG